MLNSRSLFKETVALGISSMVAGCFATAESKTLKPDIVLFLTDDLSWHDIGCYGNKDVKTPNIDRLAKEGVRFTHSFTATAMCAPTRQQLYTGLFPVRSGAFPNHSQVKPGTKSIVHHLKKLGYRVGLGGKTHFGPRKSFPFEKVCGRKLDFKKINKFISKDKTQPYCLIVCSNNPHAPWTEGDSSQYNPDELTLPSYFVDTPQTRKSLVNYYAEVTEADRELGKVMELVKNNGKVDNTVTIFTSEQGSSFPFAKWTCYDNGLRTATVIRWPGKVKANTVSTEMIQYVDFVPTLVDIAGGSPLQCDTGRPDVNGKTGFDGKSFKKVLLEQKSDHNEMVFGVHTTNGIIAGSVYPVRSVRDRRYKLIWNLNHKGNFQNLVTASAGKLPKGKEKYKCHFWPEWVEKAKNDSTLAQLVDKYSTRPEYELYDTQTDPFERSNLIDNPEYQEKIVELKKCLTTWMQQQGDKGMETEKSVSKRH